MAERRSRYEIYWEILTFCKTAKSFTGIINRCDLNSKTGQEHIEFLVGKRYLTITKDEGKTLYTATEKADGYITQFCRLYQSVFDEIPGFRL